MPRLPPNVRTDYRLFLPLTTRWMDNDAFGHLNNVVYYSIMVTAVCHTLVGRGILQASEGSHILVMAESGCRYHSEIAFPDAVIAGVRVGLVGTRSVRHEVGLFRGEAEVSSADGFMVHVCVDAVTRRPDAWPERWRLALLEEEDRAMDVGLRGKRAIVCAASKGLGRACAMALAREGVEVVITARTAETLERTAADIRAETGMAVTAVQGDITTAAGQAAALAACPAPDILVNNAGGPPAGDFREWEREDWIRALDANMLTPIALIKAVVDGMIGRKFGRIVNITSGSVKSPIPTLGMSNGARAGLTGFVGGLARQVARHNVTINNLLPGPFLTDRLRGNAAGAAQAAGKTVDEVLAERARASPAGRNGDPAEFGDACVFLCAASSGFIVGQNLLLDGGAFNSTMG